MDWSLERKVMQSEIRRMDFDFEEMAMKLFELQARLNPLYKQYLELIRRPPGMIRSMDEIPFLPIRFFKEFEVRTGSFNPERIFLSSGTGNMVRSQHLVRELEWYHWISRTGFEQAFNRPISDFIHLAYLPSYVLNPQSSLLEMIKMFIERSGGGFFHDDVLGMTKRIESNQTGKSILIWGVSYALFQWKEKKKWGDQCQVIETGGMKGQEKEITREELHQQIVNNFGVPQVISEYGMTELMSQSYAQSDGKFVPKFTFRIVPRNMNDPLSNEHAGLTSALNVVDLANLDSCAFIATDDIGRVDEDGRFTVMGRLDSSDIRGCNLLI
jgi:hypothetical protein